MSYLTKKTYGDKLKDPRWQKKRLEILSRDGFSCWWCGDKDSTLHVHHEAYVGDPWEAPDYCLMTVCDECHRIEHLPLTTLERLLLQRFRNDNMRNFESIKLMNKVVNQLKNGE